MTPELENDKPLGRLPGFIAHVYGAVPPDAARVVLKLEPTMAGLELPRVAVVIVRGLEVGAGFGLTAVTPHAANIATVAMMRLIPAARLPNIIHLPQTGAFARTPGLAPKIRPKIRTSHGRLM